MAILLDETTNVIVQGITGRQARQDSENCLAYGTRIVAGVTPGRGGQEVLGVPVFNTVKAAVRHHAAQASVIYVPARAARDAVMEAIDAGIRLILVTSEGIARQKMAVLVAEAKRAGVTLVGPNTNGIISAGRSKLGGIGGTDPSDIYAPGRIGICSRSGGMTAELALTIKQGGYGVSTAIAMGGDRITGGTMLDYVRMFEDDDDTDAILVYGEPGSRNEADLSAYLHANGVRKPIVAVIAGQFQENYPAGVSFGHAAAMISSDADTATAKRRMLAEAGVIVSPSLADIPALLDANGIKPGVVAMARGTKASAGK